MRFSYGFETRRAFSLDDIAVEIDIKSVRENPVVIEEIRIQAPIVNAEITKTGASAGKVTSEIAGSEVDRLVKEKLGGSLGDKAKGLLEKIGK